MLPMEPNEKGLTLTEVTVVAVLATVVMLGLTGFYLSSQFTWIDGSAKAMAQREGTFLLETMRNAAHTANWYDAMTPHRLALGRIGDAQNPFYVFTWDPADSALLAGPPGAEERILQSNVRRFDVTFVDSSVVELTALELVSSTGQAVTFRSKFALLNREIVP